MAVQSASLPNATDRPSASLAMFFARLSAMSLR